MKFKNFLSKVKSAFKSFGSKTASFFKSLGKRIAAFFKALGPKTVAIAKAAGPKFIELSKLIGAKTADFFKALGAKLKNAFIKLGEKIKKTPKKKLITYTLVPVLIISLCLVLVLCSDGRNDGQQGGGGSNIGGDVSAVQVGPKYDLITEGEYKGTYKVVGYVFPEGETEVELVEEYQKCKVTMIDIRAFAKGNTKDINGKDVEITSVIIPNSIKVIGEYAFSDCDALTSIVIPESVTEIKARAFNNCSNLVSVTFGCASAKDAQLTIGSYAFANCTKLELPHDHNFVDEKCACGAELKADHVHEYTESICVCGAIDPAHTHTYVSGICECGTPESLLNNVISIGESAFENCASIKSLVIPSTLKALSDSAFYKCTSLEAVSFANGSVLEKIEPSAFKDCTKLSYIAISEGVTAISKYVFRGCSSLAKIDLPESLKSIGEGAFLGCEALKTVNVPKADYLSGIVLNGTYADPTVYGATVIAK